MSSRWNEVVSVVGRTRVGDTDVPAPRVPVHRYVAAALVRHAKLWLVIAFVGALTGLGVAALPQPSEASTRLLLSHRSGDDPESAMLTDVELATSRTVAERVVTRLRLPETPEDLLKRYTATVVSDRVLELTVAADSPAAATRQVKELGATVLEYRLEQARARQEPARRQLADARKRAEHNAVPKVDQSEQLARKQRIDALQTVVGAEDAAVSKVGESRVLDRAAPVTDAAAGGLVSGLMYGFAGGLAVGVAFVVGRTVFSGPLWQRQAIARVLGAPVTSSVGRVARRRWWHRYLARLPWIPDVDWLRVAVTELRDTVEQQRPAKPTLLVVPIGCPRASALVLASLAVAYAQDGKRVLVTDLSGRRRLARALGAPDPGTLRSPREEADGKVVVHVPEPGDTVRGCLEPDDRVAGYDVLRIEWAVADVVLTYTDITPTDGVDHLHSWSHRALALVSASWTSATKLRVTSDLLDLAGVKLESATLLGAHRLDRLTNNRQTGRARTTALSS